MPENSTETRLVATPQGLNVNRGLIDEVVAIALSTKGDVIRFLPHSYYSFTFFSKLPWQMSSE